MATTTITLNTRYTQTGVIPPRCRKPRDIDHDFTTEITIKTASADDLKTAYIIDDTNPGEPEIKRPVAQYDGHFYTPAIVYPDTTTKPYYLPTPTIFTTTKYDQGSMYGLVSTSRKVFLGKNVRPYGSAGSYMAQHYAEQAIVEQARNLLDVDGQIWYRTTEPFMVIHESYQKLWATARYNAYYDKGAFSSPDGALAVKFPLSQVENVLSQLEELSRSAQWKERYGVDGFSALRSNIREEMGRVQIVDAVSSDVQPVLFPGVDVFASAQELENLVRGNSTVMSLAQLVGSDMAETASKALRLAGVIRAAGFVPFDARSDLSFWSERDM